jgi:CRISPR/Cas system CMR subunit Cmr6 (Cas7 group RAMP superfamily)
MKQRLDISFDTEIVDKLRGEINYSNVVNEQMKIYYNEGCIENLTILNKNLAEIKRKQREISRKKKEIVKKIDRIHQKEKEISKIVKPISQMTKEELREKFKKVNERRETR